MQPRIARTVPVSVRSKRPGDSKVHLAMIRRLPCCLPGCGSGGDAHHLLGAIDGLPKGVGRKNEDRWTLPVCRAHHDAAHRAGNDEAWFAGNGVQARDLARALWANTGDEEAMRRTVLRHKQTARMP